MKPLARWIGRAGASYVLVSLAIDSSLLRPPHRERYLATPLAVNAEVIRHLTEHPYWDLQSIAGGWCLPLAAILGAASVLWIPAPVRWAVALIVFSAGYFWVRTSDLDFLLYLGMNALYVVGSILTMAFAHRTIPRVLDRPDLLAVAGATILWGWSYRASCG